MGEPKENSTKLPRKYSATEHHSKDITFDDVLVKYTGGFGAYQITLFFIIGVNAFAISDPIGMNFIGYTQDHWCYIEELQHLPVELQKAIAIPTKGLDKDGNPVYESCLYYKQNYSQFSKEDFTKWNRSVLVRNTTEVARCDNGWNYDKSLIPSSIVSKWDLVCGKGWLVQFSSTIYYAGQLIGSVAVGPFSDRYGRKIGLLLFTVIKLVAAFITALAPNYILMVFAQFFLAFGGVGIYNIGFSLILEIVAPDYRTIIGMAYAIIYSLSFMFIAIFAFFVRDETNLQFALAAIPCFIIISWWFLPESPRWLLLNQKFDEAQKIVEKIASVNGKSLPKDFHIKDLHISGGGTAEQSTMFDIFRSPVLRKRCVIICIHWFTDSLIFMALSLNSATLFGSLYLNTLLLGAVEIPANLIGMLTMNWRRIGRRGTSFLSLLGAGLACILCVPLLITGASPSAVTALSLIGKGGATMGFNCIYVYTAELYPTVVRNAGIGIGSFSSRFSGMIAPYVGGPLGDIWAPMPSVIFGSFSLVAAGLSLLLPETLGTSLPETIAAAEKEHRLRTASAEVYDNRSYLPDAEQGTSSIQKRPQGYTNEIKRL